MAAEPGGGIVTGRMQRRVAYHEAGHAVIGLALGMPLDAVSVRSTECYAGISPLAPAAVPDMSGVDPAQPTPIFLPPKIRRALEIRLWTSWAGELAEDLMQEPRSGYIAFSDS